MLALLDFLQTEMTDLPTLSYFWSLKKDNENFKLLWDFSIQIDKKLDHNRPDIMFVDKQNKNFLMYH